MNFLKLILFLLIVIGGLYYILIFFLPQYLPGLYPQKSEGFINIPINDQDFRLEVADTEEKREKGLADRESIKANEGMIFIFNDSASHPFWMRNMMFPLDIIWLKNKKVVNFEENVRPDLGFEARFYGQGIESDAVIELPAGTAKRVGIQVGDRLSF